MLLTPPRWAARRAVRRSPSRPRAPLGAVGLGRRELGDLALASEPFASLSACAALAREVGLHQPHLVHLLRAQRRAGRALRLHSLVGRLLAACASAASCASALSARSISVDCARLSIDARRPAPAPRARGPPPARARSWCPKNSWCRRATGRRCARASPPRRLRAPATRRGRRGRGVARCRCARSGAGGLRVTLRAPTPSAAASTPPARRSERPRATPSLRPPPATSAPHPPAGGRASTGVLAFSTLLISRKPVVAGVPTRRTCPNSAKSLWRDVADAAARRSPSAGRTQFRRRPAPPPASSSTCRRCSRRSASCRSGCSGARARRRPTPPSAPAESSSLLSKSRADLVVLVPRADVRARARCAASASASHGCGRRSRRRSRRSPTPRPTCCA